MSDRGLEKQLLDAIDLGELMPVMILSERLKERISKDEGFILRAIEKKHARIVSYFINIGAPVNDFIINFSEKCGHSSISNILLKAEETRLSTRPEESLDIFEKMALNAIKQKDIHRFLMHYNQGMSPNAGNGIFLREAIMNNSFNVLSHLVDSGAKVDYQMIKLSKGLDDLRFFKILNVAFTEQNKTQRKVPISIENQNYNKLSEFNF